MYNVPLEGSPYMKNTRILYQYRDASNYKVLMEAIFAGAVTVEQCVKIKKALRPCDAGSLGTFIPGQIGLRDLQNSFYEKPIALAEAVDDQEMVDALKAAKPIWWPDDGPFHEVLMIDHVSAPPTHPESIGEIAAAILDVDWGPEYLPPFHTLMVESHEKHLREEGPEI